MSSGGEDQDGYQREPSPDRFLFVNMDGLHDTLKKDIRAHVSRHSHREARSRASQIQRGALAWGYQTPAGPASKSRTDAAKKAERKDGGRVAVSVPSGSSPDFGYDSMSSDLVKEGVVGPLRKTQDCLESILLTEDNDLIGNLNADGYQHTGEAAASSSPSQEQRRDAQSVAVAAYARDEQARRIISQRALFQKSSAWSPVDSMPLDPFDSLPLPLNHTDQSVLLSCKFVNQVFDDTGWHFVGLAANTVLTQSRLFQTQCTKYRAQEQSIVIETGQCHLS
jgi:hypothetical protein